METEKFDLPDLPQISVFQENLTKLLIALKLNNLVLMCIKKAAIK